MASPANDKTAADGARLNATAWTRAALLLLAEQGIDAVRVEPLAKRLGVTKGSFYWHFKDRGALTEAMLEDWRRRATIDIIDRLERDHEPPEARLRKLLRLPLSGPRSEAGAQVELSIRLWARRDPKVRAALEEVDQLRLRYIGQLLRACGVAAEQADSRAVLTYSYIRVAATLMTKDQTDLIAACERILIGR